MPQTNNANGAIDLITMPSALLSQILRTQDLRQKQVVIRHRGRSPNTMRLLITVLIASCSIACAGSAGDATDTVDVVGKIVHGLAGSKIDELTCRSYEDGRSSYHLTTVDYLGTLQRDGKRYTVAAAQFVRSSAKDSQFPPARGHGFLLVFDDGFRVVTYGRRDFASYYMDGDFLKTGDTVVVDFTAADPATRYHGWLVDSGFMPYPFADRISEDEWQSGAFLKGLSEEDTKSGIYPKR